MKEEDKNLNKKKKQEEKVSKLWVFSDKDKNDLIRILWVDVADKIEQERIQKEKDVEIRKNKIISWLNQKYLLSNENGFWENDVYKFYDEWDVIIASHEWNSQIFEFDGSNLWYNKSLPYRMITKVWNGYVWVIATLADTTVKEKKVKSKHYVILNNKWVKQYSLLKEPQFHDDLEGISVHTYIIKNNYKVFAIYDKELNLLVKHIPEWFRVLSTLNWEILFQREQLDIAGEDFVVMHQWDDREEKRVGGYALKDSPIYMDYISKLDSNKK